MKSKKNVCTLEIRVLSLIVLVLNKTVYEQGKLESAYLSSTFWFSSKLYLLNVNMKSIFYIINHLFLDSAKSGL